MTTLRQLLARLAKLECRRNADVEFEAVEEFVLEGEFSGECHYVLRRNGMAIFR